VASKVQGCQWRHLIQKLHTSFCPWFVDCKEVCTYSKIELSNDTFDNELTVLKTGNVFYIAWLPELTETAALSPKKHLF
jgi:hypothetical protein